MSRPEETKTSRFLSNQTQFLLCIQRAPDVRFRDIGQVVGITERAAQRIVADLIESGYVESERVGRRNHYRVNTDAAMRHPAQEGHDVGELLRLLSPAPRRAPPGRGGPRGGRAPPAHPPSAGPRRGRQLTLGSRAGAPPAARAGAA